jgi:molybdopterin molybdotransferase
MVSVKEATGIVLDNLFNLTEESIRLEESVGRVLAEDIHADRDFPPFNRVSMDGISIQFDQWMEGKRRFPIEGIQAAGSAQKVLTNPENCMEVMTGAMLPQNSDCVIRYEDVQIENGVAKVLVDSLEQLQNVHRQGVDAKVGENLLKRGMLLSPAEIALLASVGKAMVRVYAFPKTAIISTGDELVEIEKTPALHEIRRSNVYAIHAAMKQMNWNGTIFHLPDNKQILQNELAVISKEYDVIILSGGVSKGKFDFVPEVLESIGIKKLFHSVSQRPGKPFWFGVSKSNFVFALPGNPVSTYMCFYRFIKPWILKSLGVVDQPLTAILASNYTFLPKLSFFLQVLVRCENGSLVAYPHAGGGSGDFANLKNVSGFLELPLEKDTFLAGESYPYIPFRN